jgi:hypothetical protein
MLQALGKGAFSVGCARTFSNRFSLSLAENENVLSHTYARAPTQVDRCRQKFPFAPPNKHNILGLTIVEESRYALYKTQLVGKAM